MNDGGWVEFCILTSSTDCLVFMLGKLYWMDLPSNRSAGAGAVWFSFQAGKRKLGTSISRLLKTKAASTLPAFKADQELGLSIFESTTLQLPSGALQIKSKVILLFVTRH